MVGCAAPNCSNNSRHGCYKFYRFPSDVNRRKRWLINSRRQDWTPTSSNYLCNVHFEESQFEQNRADNKRKLKPNAIPTLFDVPNAPLPLDRQRKSIYKRTMEHGSSEPTNSQDMQVAQIPELNTEELKNRIAVLERENSSLKERLTRFDRELNNFLNLEQIDRLSKNQIHKWSEENIVKGLKLRFMLGKEGYNYLRKTGYPSPSYGTLNNHIRGVTLCFGIFDFIFVLLKSKVDVMKDFEKDCVLLIDEMEISCSIQYDNQRKTFCGSVTLGNSSAKGSHLTVVVLRGITSKWKQVVAAHITGPSTAGSETRSLILTLIEKATEIGLNVCAVVSDMGGMNRSLWCALGISVTRSERKVSFQHASSEIFVVADVPHLVKNWRSAIQSSYIYIPQYVADKEGLSSTVVTSDYIEILWTMELNNETGLRSLYHLSNSCLTPSHYEKMNVGLALRFLSLKTASALETAVALKILPPEALTTAWFIRFLNEWFTLLMSRCVQKSLTKNNIGEKVEFLENFVKIINETKIGDSGWKPLHTGSIMSTLSFICIAKAACNKGYGYLMGSRFSQDALENLFSQIRKKAGMNPSALDARKALKLITVTQFMTPLSNTNYCSDSDRALLSFSDTNLKVLKTNIQSNLPGPSTSTDNFSDLELNNLHYVAGASVNAVLKKICDECKKFLTKNGHDVPEKFTKLCEFSDFGGLKYISPVGFDILRTAERFIKNCSKDLMSSNISMGTIVNYVCDLHTEVPPCCNVVKELVAHYADIRGIGLCSFQEAKRKLQTTYGRRLKKK